MVLLACSVFAERTLQCSVNAKDPVQISDRDGELDHASKGSWIFSLPREGEMAGEA